MSNIVSKEVRRRGFFGWLFLLLFIGFNLLMFWWLWSYWELVGTQSLPTSDAGRAGAAIGTAIGTGAILFVWLVGAVITGFFAMLTRGKRVYIHAATEPSIGFDTRACPYCAERIKPEAVVCRYCGRDVAPQQEIVPLTSIARRYPSRFKALRNAAAICFVVAAAITAVLWQLATSAKKGAVVTDAASTELAKPTSVDAVVTDITSKEPAKPAQVDDPPRPQPDRWTAIHDLELTDLRWKKGGFDNVMLATFSFHNKNQFDVKDISVICEHSSPSGTKIDSNRRTIYEIIKANGKKTFREFNMGWIHSQATRSSCWVDDLVIGDPAPANAAPRPTLTTAAAKKGDDARQTLTPPAPRVDAAVPH
jgi:hypothetical protein